MKFRYKLPKTPAELLVLALTFLALLKKVPALVNRSNQVVTDEYFTSLTELFRQLCEEAKYNSLKLAQRNTVQAELTELMKKLYHFVEAVGDEKDIAIIQESGIELGQASKKKTHPHPAAATSAGDSEH